MQKGFSLLETLLYIALLAIVLPGFVLFYIQLSQRQAGVDEAIVAEQRAAAIFSQLSHDILAAESINVTGSTLGVNPSTLVFVNDAGETVTIDRPTETTAVLHRTNALVSRLRMQVNANPIVYLTNPEVEVTTWQVDTVRNGVGVLTGLNITLELDVRKDSPSAAHFEAMTTIDLAPHTTEL